MILEPIDAQEFARARRRLPKSPAACQWPQLLRLFLLVSVGLAVISLTFDPGRMMAAGSQAAIPPNSNPA
jgi:hypothetical protein